MYDFCFYGNRRVGRRLASPRDYNSKRHGKIWLSDLRCSGFEEDISHCEHGGWGVRDIYCASKKDVWISCHSLDEHG